MSSDPHVLANGYFPKPISSFNVNFWLVNLPNTSISRRTLSLSVCRPSDFSASEPASPPHTDLRQGQSLEPSAHPAASSDSVPFGAAASPQLWCHSRGRWEAGPGRNSIPILLKVCPPPLPAPQAGQTPVRTFTLYFVKRKPHTHSHSSIIGSGPKVEPAQVSTDG